MYEIICLIGGDKIMLFFISYRTKGGFKKVRYFIDPTEAMRLEKKLSVKKGITDIVLGKA